MTIEALEVRPAVVPSLAVDVLKGEDRPVVKIVVEGVVGQGKTALLSLIAQALQGHVQLYLENQYTLEELRLKDDDDLKTLKMYNPIVVLEERLVKKV